MMSHGELAQHLLLSTNVPPLLNMDSDAIRDLAVECYRISTVFNEKLAKKIESAKDARDGTFDYIREHD